MKNAKNGLIVILLILMSLPIFIIGIQRSFGITDEACYAEVTKEMVKSGDWMTFSRWGRPFYEKPPLLFWIMGFFFKIFGMNIITARLPVVFFGIGVIVFTYLLGREIFEEKDKDSIFFACLVTLTTPSIITYGHGALMDIPLLFFILMGTYFLIKSEKVPYFSMFFGISLGLGIMMKGPMALVLVFGFIPYIILKKKWQYFTNPYLYIGLILMVVIVLPWHIYEIVKNGKDFIDSYFGEHIFRRMTTHYIPTVINTKTGIFFYPISILFNFLPWSVFLLQALWQDIKNIKISDKSAILVSFIITNLVVLTLIKTHLDQYAIIFYPFLSLSVGTYLPRAIKDENANRLSLKVGSIVYLVLGLILVTASIFVFLKFNYYILWTIPALIFASIIFSFSFIYFFRNKLSIWKKMILNTLGWGFYSGWIISLIFVPFWDYHSDFKSFIFSAKNLIPEEEVVYGVVPDRILYMRDPLHFHLDNPVKDVGEENISKVWNSVDSLILITHKTVYEKNLPLLSRGIKLFESEEWILLKKGNP